MKLKNILIETQTCNTLSEEQESSPRVTLEVTILILVKRREEMLRQKLGMSHGTAVTLLRLLASAKVPYILVLPMLMTLEIDSRPSPTSDTGNISLRRLMTGPTAL